MQEYKLTIATRTDGKETKIRKLGEVQEVNGELTLSYTDENSKVILNVEAGKAKIIRIGDYSMQLYLEEGKKVKGVLQIADGHGEIEVYTHRAEFSIKKDKALITLIYDILFGEEKQKMEIHVLAVKA